MRAYERVYINNIPKRPTNWIELNFNLIKNILNRIISINLMKAKVFLI